MQGERDSDTDWDQLLVKALKNTQMTVNECEIYNINSQKYIIRDKIVFLVYHVTKLNISHLVMIYSSIFNYNARYY